MGEKKLFAFSTPYLKQLEGTLLPCAKVILISQSQIT